jgi:hypothetical protein
MCKLYCLVGLSWTPCQFICMPSTRSYLAYYDRLADQYNIRELCTECACMLRLEHGSGTTEQHATLVAPHLEAAGRHH